MDKSFCLENRQLIVFDQDKNEKNIRKHNIDFIELASIFANTLLPPEIDIPDPGHSEDEDRFWAFGWTRHGWYVWVWYTYRDGAIRIIGGKKLR